MKICFVNGAHRTRDELLSSLLDVYHSISASFLPSFFFPSTEQLKCAGRDADGNAAAANNHEKAGDARDTESEKKKEEESNLPSTYCDGSGSNAVQCLNLLAAEHRGGGGGETVEERDNRFID